MTQPTRWVKAVAAAVPMVLLVACAEAGRDNAVSDETVARLSRQLAQQDSSPGMHSERSSFWCNRAARRALTPSWNSIEPAP